MIGSGQLASEKEIRRFQTESEAAANLQHPNIVSIHEVGKHEESHYFSMDYGGVQIQINRRLYIWLKICA